MRLSSLSSSLLLSNVGGVRVEEVGSELSERQLDVGAVLSDALAVAPKEIAQSNERVETGILNMLIPECGVPIPSVMSVWQRKEEIEECHVVK